MLKNSQNNFVDYIKIYCKSGNGGKGSAHFLDPEFNQKDTDGGDGGRGGMLF